MRGKFETTLSYGPNSIVSQSYVMEEGHGMLQGCRVVEDLGITTFAFGIPQETIQHILAEFPTVFEGIGQLKGKEIHLHMNPTVQPVALRHRHIAFHLRPLVEKELAKLEAAGIIEKVTGPTPWVSPIVITQKPKQPGEVRICIDMRLPSAAIKREIHLTPTADDLIGELSGACSFSKLDLRSGYHQLVLDEESRYITTFSTHVGLRRYTRLSFSVSSAAEVFQNTIQELLMDLPGVMNVGDDIFIHTKTIAEHNAQLTKVLQRIQEAGLTLHRNKCKFLKQTLQFFGYVISASGVTPDPEKVRDIKGAPTPTTVTEIISFLGMVNYFGRFIRDLTTLTQPL